MEVRNTNLVRASTPSRRPSSSARGCFLGDGAGRGAHAPRPPQGGGARRAASPLDRRAGGARPRCPPRHRLRAPRRETGKCGTGARRARGRDGLGIRALARLGDRFGARGGAELLGLARLRGAGAAARPAPSPQSDVYSLGVLLYELATGVRPFDANDPTAVIRGHLEWAAAPPSARNSRISPFLDAVLLACLEKSLGEADRLGAGAGGDPRAGGGVAFLARAARGALALGGAGAPPPPHELPRPRGRAARAQCQLCAGRRGAFPRGRPRGDAGSARPASWMSSSPGSPRGGSARRDVWALRARRRRAPRRAICGNGGALSWDSARSRSPTRGGAAPARVADAGADQGAPRFPARPARRRADRRVRPRLRRFPPGGGGGDANLGIPRRRRRRRPRHGARGAGGGRGGAAACIVGVRPAQRPSRFDAVLALARERRSLASIELEPLQAASISAIVDDLVEPTRGGWSCATRSCAPRPGIPATWRKCCVRSIDGLARPLDGPQLSGRLRFAEAMQEVPIARSLSDAVLERLSKLAPEERRALELLAVAGDRCDAQLLASAFGGDAMGWLRTLSRLVSPHGWLTSAAGSFRFARPMLHEVIYQSMGEAARAQAHQKFAEALERKLGSHPTDRERLRVAEHARRSGDSKLALEHLPGLAEDFRRRGLFERALVLARAGDRSPERAPAPRSQESRDSLRLPRHMCRMPLADGEPPQRADHAGEVRSDRPLSEGHGAPRPHARIVGKVLAGHWAILGGRVVSRASRGARARERLRGPRRRRAS